MARETEIPDEQEPTEHEIGEMIEESEREIFRSALSDDEPDGGDDRSPEQMQDFDGRTIGDDGEPIEDPAEEEPTDEEAQAEQPEEVVEEPEESDRRGAIPSGRLRESEELRRIAEHERNELRERVARLEGAQQAYRQPPPQPQQPQARPDPVLDPDGFNRWIDAEFEQRQIARVAKMIDAAAADPDDGWKVQAAGAHIKRTFDQNNPAHMQMLERLTLHSADPVASIVKYWERNGGAAEMREREAAINEEKRQRLEATAAELGYQLTPARRQSQSRTAIETDTPTRVVTRVPRSLNGASGHGGNGRNRVNDPEYETDGSEAAIFRSAFEN